MYSIVFIIGRDIVQRIERVWAEADIGCRKDIDDRVVADATRERNRLGDPELVCKGDNGVEAVPATHEHELHVITPGALDSRRSVNCEVDSVLRPHHSQVGAEVAFALSPIRNW